MQQEDIGPSYLRISDSLAMVGVTLTASWQSTRKLKCDDLQARIQNTVGAWKSGKFMPFICRPFSLNTYALSKVWFRTSSVDLRAGDFSAITSKCKSYLYQDLLIKPGEVLLFRPTDEGGLGLHHIQSKSLAHLVATFLQTAAKTGFARSLFHETLYRYHVLGELDLPNPGYTPYYNAEFFRIIKDVKENTPLNPKNMLVKEWYRHLVEKNVTMREIDNEGRMEKRLCRSEEKEPDIDWFHSYRLSRTKGLSNESKSFWFKQLHELHTTKFRVHQILPNNSALCWCNSGVEETYLHCFFECVKNKEAAAEIIHLTQVYDADLSASKALKLQIKAENIYESAAVLILTTGLELIWKNRSERKSTSLAMIRSELESAVNLRRRSRNTRVRETAAIVSNTLQNFA